MAETSQKAAVSPKTQKIFGSWAGMLAACLIACFLWGSAFPCVKIGYALFGIAASDAASIIMFAGVRFTLAGLLVVAALSIARRKLFLPEKRDLKVIGILSLFQTILQYLFFYVGLAHATGVTSSIIEATNTFFSVLLAALVFRNERLTTRKVLGCIVGFAGVALVDLAGQTGAGFTFTLAGEGLVLASTIAAATSSKQSASLRSTIQVPGSSSSAASFSAGGHVAPAPASILSHLLLLYLAFISAAAYSRLFDVSSG
jgi:drug/metabolite transporter (DMT)-like permease